MAQSFLGESVGVNDTGDSEKPRTIATLGRFMYWLEDKTGVERITVNGVIPWSCIVCRSSPTSGPCGHRMRKCCTITRNSCPNCFQNCIARGV
ncbi:uncharacterized protein LOC108153400 isoform X3 [Drosophila miranda]|uniref:uncharacterized protein LOC108153400 isoform X3 n=1 Tax=Drosophila miranda TaxID=7229 RepID=UPI00143F0C70|nr:uncharacterized protein LOC108153400 isoform X3 [Drosophila miranda]